MKKALLFVMIFLFAVSVSAQNEVDIYIFHGEGCPHCAKLLEWMEEVELEYDINVVDKEIYYNETNMKLFKLMSYIAEREIEGVPATFIDDKVFVGFSDSPISIFEDSIKDQIAAEIERCSVEECSSPIKRLENLSNEEIKNIVGDSSGLQPDDDLTIARITALAAADAVNPCAFAVLTLVLVAIMSANPKNKKKILTGGLSFSLSVFVLYLIYGLIIIQVFKTFAQFITPIKIYLVGFLAVVAIILGVLNLRDFFRYRPGGMFTEMPLHMRPRMKKMIAKITSPGGAFVIGAFVTLFLLPCTIGPYLIASGMLSFMDILKTLPWLIYYNLIFVAPMVAITLIVYFGISTAQKMSGWKEHNIRWMHLAAGVILVLVGAAILLGWI